MSTNNKNKALNKANKAPKRGTETEDPFAFLLHIPSADAPPTKENPFGGIPCIVEEESLTPNTTQNTPKKKKHTGRKPEIFVFYRKRKYTIKSLAALLGITPQCMQGRYNAGFRGEALAAPVRKKRTREEYAADKQLLKELQERRALLKRNPFLDCTDSTLQAPTQAPKQTANHTAKEEEQAS